MGLKRYPLGASYSPVKYRSDGYGIQVLGGRSKSVRVWRDGRVIDRFLTVKRAREFIAKHKAGRLDFALFGGEK